MKKNNQKPYIYPVISILVVIIFFVIMNFWSVGDFENYKKISKFKIGLLSKDFKFKQFPPNEFLGVKLYDDFEKYLLTSKDKLSSDDLNNNKYYYSDDEKKIKIVNPLPEYFDDTTVVANENDEIVGIISVNNLILKNNNNLLDFCTKTRNSFLKQHNLSKLNSKKEYYSIDGEFHDFKNFDLQINNNNVRFSIICGYIIRSSSIKYQIMFFLYDINLWKDIMIKENFKITSKKFSHNDIKKYRVERYKKQ
jgi:hypothetical protein